MLGKDGDLSREASVKSDDDGGEEIALKHVNDMQELSKTRRIQIMKENINKYLVAKQSNAAWLSLVTHMRKPLEVKEGGCSCWQKNQGDSYKNLGVLGIWECGGDTSLVGDW